MDAKESEARQRRINEALVGALRSLEEGYTIGHVSTACTKMIAAMFILKYAPATDELVEEICRQTAAHLRSEIKSGLTDAILLGKNRPFACVGLEEEDEEEGFQPG